MPMRPALGLQRAGMTATSHSSSPSGLSSVRLWPAFAALATLWLVSLPLACLPGPVPLAAGQVFHALAAQLGLATPPQDTSLMLVVGQIRLARVCLATLCGGALAVAGVALQGVLRNPLACLLYTSSRAARNRGFNVKTSDEGQGVTRLEIEKSS